VLVIVCYSRDILSLGYARKRLSFKRELLRKMSFVQPRAKTKLILMKAFFGA